MSDQALRLIEMLRAIPREGKVSTADLARRLEEAGFPINKRSVQRDLERLSQLYPLIVDMSSKPYGWQWARDAKPISLPGLSEAEALTFNLVERHLEGLLPLSTLSDLEPYFRAAREKLASSSSRSPLGNWTRRIRVVAPQQPLLAPKLNREVRRAVTLALLQSVQLEISYFAPWTDAPKKHRIHPLGLVQHGAVFYLCVRFYEYPEPRMLALHRITAAKPIELRAEPPEGFDLDQWIEEGAFGFGELGKPIKLDIEFKDHAGDVLLETRLSEDQTNTGTAGNLRIRATVMDTQRLRWWILGFGSRVKVHAPRALRQEIAQQHRDAAASYLD
jgi:predicted DNA-binding transcriptional regulator YafY